MIPSTITTEDRNAEKKKLEQEIAVLKSVRDTAHQESKNAVASADAIVERIKSLTGEIKELEELRITASNETHEFIVHCTRIIRDCEKKMTEMVYISKSLAKGAEIASQTLVQAKKDAKAVHETAVQEEKLMQRQREDLEIYHERLRAYFAEHLPEQSVII